ncbi:MAG: type IX secretion system sortase PorU, partial [Flavobacteriales bacterium]|nr:type IX secretion system sortase PorU [Flavobacteriales bacterium]
VNFASQDFTFNDSGISGNYAGQYADTNNRVFCGSASGPNLPILVNFTKHDQVSSVGWMNFLELNCRRELKMTGDQLMFRDPVTVGAGRVGEFTVDQAGSVYRIWEITDPSNTRNVAFTDNGAQKVFRLATDSLREFIAFKNSGYLEPTAIGPSPNQDLHAAAEVDLVLVCPEQFQGEAQRLAERRMEEGLSVVMVSPQQIYNEFSSGQRDGTAIKRFMKMLYDRAGADPELLPRYLLLFGDGSYNNVNALPDNQNLIPSYQAADSWLPSGCFTTDDYYCLLDDNEGEANSDIIDVGVGRLPISNAQQAQEMVDKILNYDKLMLGTSPGTSCSSGSDGGASDWRNSILFTSDDQTGDNFEGTIHMSHSETLAAKVELIKPCLNISKVYMDAYVQVSTPGGQRYPDAQEALRSRIQKGSLIVNYVGHGGEVGWAHERLLDNETIMDWSNFDRLPLFVTATCEFTRWDDPGRTSAGEYVMLNPAGGGIGLMTTTRIAYSGANQQLALEFYEHVFDTKDEFDRPTRFGDIYRKTKVGVSDNGNYRNFALLGDPSIRLAMARQDARITAITDTLGNVLDTLHALATVRITGEVTDTTGQLLSDFNGVVVPTVFDKKVAVNTLGNDAPGQPYPFNLRKNIIYRGKATVSNGQFSFTFVVPKDINYEVGAGRVSIYAESLSTNACGFTDEPLVGGSDPNAVVDEQGPQIELFMNDETFVPGGITNEDPLLYAKLFDENGINTLGNSIGHDLVAVIDQNTQNSLVLNDVYEADLDTYKSGQVRYRLSDLAEGSHTLDLKAWDVFNNSSQRSLDFVVAPSAEMALDHVLNYPNPFTTRTEFYFEHNRPCGNLDVRVQVFTVAGRLVKTLNRQLACEGFRSEPMAWDGLDDAGDKLGRGVYVYRLSVATQDGEAADKVEKLVILR